MRSRAGRALRRLMWPVLFTGVIALLFAVGAFPTRTYLDKRHEVVATQAELDELTRANEAAQRHVDALQTDAEIERIAREQYGLVKQGEEPYRILPEAKDPVPIPDTWPFNRLHQHLED